MDMRIQGVENPVIRSYRELLGVGPKATPEEIKKSFLKLAQIYHPDKNPDPEAPLQFLRVKQAYEILKHPQEIARLNKKFLSEKLFNFCVEGLSISFGSFFGYRIYQKKDRVPRALRIGVEKPGENDKDIHELFLDYAEDISILDNPAYDSIEIVYGGKFSKEDEFLSMGGIKPTFLGRLPWVVTNNKGIIKFLEGKYEEALLCYEDLDERIPNNIIFNYRKGLCHLLLAFEKKRPSITRVKPDPHHLKLGIQCLKKAIAIGEVRTIGKQKCLLIRKTLADVFEKLGKKTQSRKIWAEIYDLNPESREAQKKVSVVSRILITGRRKLISNNT